METSSTNISFTYKNRSCVIFGDLNVGFIPVLQLCYNFIVQQLYGLTYYVNIKTLRQD